MTRPPKCQAGTSQDIGYLQRARRLCCEWAVNYQWNACCLPRDRVARCLWSTETEGCTLFPPHFLFYMVTVVAWKQKRRIASVVLGTMASQLPYGVEKVGLRFLSGTGETNYAIWFHHNCLSKPGWELIMTSSGSTETPPLLQNDTKMSALHHQKSLPLVASLEESSMLSLKSL